MKKLLRPRPLPGSAHFGVAVIRILAGAGLITHSLVKLEDPTGWMPGDVFPGWALAVAAYGELLGGALLALGLLTPLAALLVLGVMAGALKYHVDAGDPFVGTGASWELAALYAAVGLLALTAGPGAVSLDAALFRDGGKSGGK